MKPYNERLPQIDAAIDELDGEFPPTAIGYSGRGYYAKGDMANILHKINFGDVCTRQEFEQRVKEREEMSKLKLGNFYSLNELSKIDGAFDKGNSYLYVGESDGVYLSGKVYPTNGRGIVDEYDEGNHTSFCNLGGVTPDFQLVALVNSQLEDVNKNDWYEKGELPPVGDIVECCFNGLTFINTFVENWREGDQLEVLAHRVGENGAPVAVVWNKRDRYATCLISQAMRPLRTETDKLVEQAELSIRSQSPELDRPVIRKMIEAGYRKVKLMSEDEFVAVNCRVWFNGDTDAARKAYRAGLHFLDKGVNNV